MHKATQRNYSANHIGSLRTPTLEKNRTVQFESTSIPQVIKGG